MSANKQTTGFNDLNNQLNFNLQNKSKVTSHYQPPANNQSAFRGLSRGSANRGNNGNTQGGQPGTSSSQRRQTNGGPNTNLNINLINRKQNGSQQKNIDFFPIKTTSYTSTGKGNTNLNNGLKQNSDLQNENIASDDYQSKMAPGFSSLIASANNNKTVTVSGTQTATSGGAMTLPNEYAPYKHTNGNTDNYNKNLLMNGGAVTKTISDIVSPKHRNSSGLPFNKNPTEVKPSSQHNPEKSLINKITDNIRKLSYAAKAGQMQLSSAIQDHQSQIQSQTNLFDQIQSQQTSIQANNQLPSKAGNINSKSIAMAAGQNLMIPPPSNLGMHSRDSYMNMRAKKKENHSDQVMLNNLESRTSNNGQTQEGNGHNFDNFPFPGLKNSGSSFQLSQQNQIIFQKMAKQQGVNHLNQSMTMGQKKYDWDGKMSSLGLNQQQLMQQQNPQLSPTNSYLNTKINNSSESFTEQQKVYVTSANKHQILPSKRRVNALSYAADTNKILNGQNLISNKTTLKPRGAEKKLQGIAGKHIIINATAAQSVANNYYEAEKQGISATKEHVDASPYCHPLSNEKSSNFEANSKAREKDDGVSSYQNQVNCRITKKLEGRPHKVYDYMFIQMSNEQFKIEYDNRKIFLQKTQAQIMQEEEERRKQQLNQFSQYKVIKNGQVETSLNGLVQIKAIDNMMTDELPLMQCNLLPTQLDHVKMLVCEQEDKNYPKLTPDAQAKFENEKQNQIKQYMEDIIQKLKQKERRFKVTVKKKFIDDAIYNSTSIRVASVYVIVINREKAYDPLGAQPLAITNQSTVKKDIQPEDSSDEVDEFVKKKEQQIQKNKEQLRRSTQHHLSSQIRKYHYESDNQAENMLQQVHLPQADKTEMPSTNNSESSKIMPVFKAQISQAEKPAEDRREITVPVMKAARERVRHIPNVMSGKEKKVPKEELNYYRYVTPVKEFPDRYKKTRIKICQDVNAHDHVYKYSLNTYFNQYNEFVRLIFKNAKQGQGVKYSQGYALGLARALGLNIKKDAFSDQNMKSRDHVNTLKEKLAFALWKRLHDENKEVIQATEKGNNNNESSSDIDGGNSIDSTIASSNTPKSKNLGLQIKTENDILNCEQSSKAQTAAEKTRVEVQQQSQPQQSAAQFILPHTNVIYKYFIGKGNNSMMVKGLLKNRYWWTLGDFQCEGDLKNLNFVWTQNKVQKVFENMQCQYPYKRSGNKHSEFSQISATPQQLKAKKKKQSIQQPTQGSEVKPAQSKAEDVKPTQGIKHTETKLYNKIEDNFHVNNKKALYLNMKNYYEAIDQDVFDNLPLTFHIKTGLDDPEFIRFEQYYKKFDEDIKNRKNRRKPEGAKEDRDDNNSAEQSPSKRDDDEANKEVDTAAANKPVSNSNTREEKFYRSQQPEKNIWIIKPGENTNRGHGIQVAKELEEIKQIIADSTQNKKRTCILQKYIHNPLLIHRRKFDIRTFVLATSQNGNFKVYQYSEGYLRTSCREYNINNLSNKLVHLTNDAVQKQSQDYGRFEPGNKLSYNEFQAFLDRNYPDLHVCYERDILPQMNKLTIDIFRACHDKLDPKRRLHCMEVFGLDFMIDDEFRPYLIEVNTNPCLELSCPLLARLIPTMLENAMKLGMDSVFIPPEGFSSKKGFIGDPCPENKFTLVYDDKIDAPPLEKLFQAKRDVILEMDEEFSDNEDVHDDDD